MTQNGVVKKTLAANVIDTAVACSASAEVCGPLQLTLWRSARIGERR